MNLSVTIDDEVLSIYSDQKPDEINDELKVMTHFFLSNGLFYSASYRYSVDDLWERLRDLVDLNISHHADSYLLYEFFLKPLTSVQRTGLMSFLRQYGVVSVKEKGSNLTIAELPIIKSQLSVSMPSMINRK